MSETPSIQRAIILFGSMAEGFRAIGPCRSGPGWTHHDIKRLRLTYPDSLVESIQLVEDDEFASGDFVLILGDLQSGFVAHGTYSSEEQAANANSPFRDNPINPMVALVGQKPVCILELEPA